MSLLPAVIALIALLYALVGHGGASGYLAVLTLAGEPLTSVRASALLLNVLVSGIATMQFARKGHWQGRLFWPFAVASVPAAWLGGTIMLDPSVYMRVLAICLIIASARLVWPMSAAHGPFRMPPWPAAMASGAAIGLVSGLIGIGGGILLSPLLLLLGWADARSAAAVSAPFILVNSLAGLLGMAGGAAGLAWPPMPWLLAAAAGGMLGSWLGAARLNDLWMRRALAVVLIFAAAKLWMS